MIVRLSVLWCLTISAVAAQWSGDEMAMYDLVEDLGANFYDFFGITKEATTQDIKKAYRKMSLEWHPDRNSAPDATDKFRQVVSVYEILKSVDLREKYNNVLEFGLPDWRQPIYYYRKMRKFTWYEAVAVMLVVGTVAHYLMMWAAYFEKKLVLTQNVRTSLKKVKKSAEADAENARALAAALEEYLPQKTRLLPFLIVETVWTLTKMCARLAKESLEKKEEPVEEAPVERRRPVAAPRSEFVYEMASDMKAVSNLGPQQEEVPEQQIIKDSSAGWSFDELSSLIRLSTEKYPPGTPSRWELMARALNRSAEDVTAMAGKLKNMKQEEYAKLLRGQQSNSVNETAAAKTKKTESQQSVPLEWSQAEQRLFEGALGRFPKGTEDRWDRVAECVPGKTKDDCMARFKQLADMVRRRKVAAPAN